MNRDEMLDKLRDICREVFNDMDLTVNEEDTEDDVVGWDSFTFIMLINRIEQAFGIKFSFDDMKKSYSIGQLIDYIMDKSR